MPLVFRPNRDVTRDDADILINTVNTVGVMGKGVALAFKNRWPEIMAPYREACRSGALRPGGCLLFPLPDGRRWAALATKADWRAPSRYEWVESGLEELARLAATSSVAIPPPGCGNGGLDWTRVGPLVIDKLGHLDLRIYGEDPRGPKARPETAETSGAPARPSVEMRQVALASAQLYLTAVRDGFATLSETAPAKEALAPVRQALGAAGRRLREAGVVTKENGRWGVRNAAIAALDPGTLAAADTEARAALAALDAPAARGVLADAGKSATLAAAERLRRALAPEAARTDTEMRRIGFER